MAKDTLPFTTEAQRFIYDWQHPRNCYERNWVTISNNQGIGSEIHVNGATLAWAINHNATFVWAPSAWTSGTMCTQKTYECAFIAATNCTVHDLDPLKRLPTLKGGNVQTEIPQQFKTLRTEPFPLLYWWRAQSATYLTTINTQFKIQLEQLRRQHVPFSLSCGSVCVYVRHGDKGSEMELLPWRRFYTGVQLAREILALRDDYHCQSNKNQVFLMTDDFSVVADAQRSLRTQLFIVNASVLAHLPHERSGNNTPNARWENLKMSMLNLQLCAQCDAFVSQRKANFARLIDELRMTSYNKYGLPFIEVGEYSFAW